MIRRLLPFGGLIVCTALFLLLWANPLMAAPKRAAIVVDGQALFEVSAVGTLTAQERAAVINQTLTAEARDRSGPQVQLVEEDGVTVIRSRDRFLLTVTADDLRDAAGPNTQGQIWQLQLQTALERAYVERTLAYQSQSLALMGGMVVGSFLLLRFVRRKSQQFSRRLTRFLTNPSSPLFAWAEPTNKLIRWSLGTLQFCVGLGLLYVVSDRLPQTRIWRYRFYRLWSDPLISLDENVSKSIADLVWLVIVTAALWFGINLLTRWCKMSIAKQIGRDVATYELLTSLVQYLLVFLGLLIVLPLWGINLASLAFLGSFLGVGIGFGVQNIINNFVSGIIIAVERPIKVGDFVTVDNFQGTVLQVGSRSTKIRTQDQVTIIVPNSRFLENEVINRSHNDTISRLHIPVGVAYNSPITNVRQALLEAATQHKEVLLHPEPKVWFCEFGDNSLNFELLVWTAEPKEQMRVKSDLNYRIEANLRKYQIEVPFPQRDLNVRSPQLQTLVNTLLQQNGISAADLEKSPPEANDPLAFLEVEPETALVEKLSSSDIEQLVAAMRGPEGLNICDRRYRFMVHSHCFIASEAVDWLRANQECSREDAIAIGKMLGERGIIHHVNDDHTFSDGYLLFRFYVDES